MKNLVVALAAIIGSAVARKTYLVKATHQHLTQPRVSALDCKEMIYQDDNNKAYFEYEWNVELGWFWYQESNDYGAYRVRVEFYVKTDAILHPVFDYPRFYYNEQTYTVSPFKTRYNFELVYHYDPDLLCFNVFGSVEDVDVLFEMVMKLQNCYKIFINCFYDWENFQGEDAKYFDKCEQSKKEDITMYDKTFVIPPLYAYGNTDDITETGKDCHPSDVPWLPFWGKDTGLQRHLFYNLLSYFEQFDGQFTPLLTF